MGEMKEDEGKWWLALINPEVMYSIKEASEILRVREGAVERWLRAYRIVPADQVGVKGDQLLAMTERVTERSS